MKLYQIQIVTVSKHSESPLQLIIHVSGLASSTGWTNPTIDPAQDSDPEDALLEYDFTATPPADISLPVLTPISATLVVSPDRKVDAILVRARTNSSTVHASEFLPPGSGTGIPLPRPVTTRPLLEESITTFALGEETGGTFIRGEDPTTLRLGEEGPTTDPRLDDPMGPIGGELGGPFGQF